MPRGKTNNPEGKNQYSPGGRGMGKPKPLQRGIKTKPPSLIDRAEAKLNRLGDVKTTTSGTVMDEKGRATGTAPKTTVKRGKLGTSIRQFFAGKTTSRVRTGGKIGRRTK